MTTKPAGWSDGLDAPAAQDEVQVGAGKTAQSTFALDNDILRLRLSHK